MINYALGLVGLISFVLLIVAGITMVTNAGDDNYDNGARNLCCEPKFGRVSG